MTAKRSRTIHSSILFGGVTVDGHRIAGQPYMVRMQGIPTAPGSRDRPGRWNFSIPEWVRRLANPNPVPAG